MINNKQIRVGDIIHSKFVSKTPVSGRYYVGSARKVLSVNNDGSITSSVVGEKWDVTEDIMELIDEAIRERNISGQG